VRDRVSVATIDGDTVTYAHFGANNDTEYEIGSITKTVTSLLLADAIPRGAIVIKHPLDIVGREGIGRPDEMRIPRQGRNGRTPQVGKRPTPHLLTLARVQLQ